MSQEKNYLFKGMDGYAGFRLGQEYLLTPDKQEEGHVYVRMPHAPTAGVATFDAKQWADWWEKK